MRRIITALGITVLAVLPAAAQQIEIQPPRPSEVPQARVVPPPLQREQTRPLPDSEVHPRRSSHVEHDPAFIEPFAGTYATATTSGRYGLSGWTAPNPPIGPPARDWHDHNGWFALGFSVTWDGPPAPTARDKRPAR